MAQLKLEDVSQGWARYCHLLSFRIESSQSLSPGGSHPFCPSTMSLALFPAVSSYHILPVKMIVAILSFSPSTLFLPSRVCQDRCPSRLGMNNFSTSKTVAQADHGAWVWAAWHRHGGQGLGFPKSVIQY